MTRPIWLVLFGAGVHLGVGSSVAGGQTTLEPAASANAAIGISAEEARPVDSVVHRRTKAIEYSDWYARRLAVHRIGSYVMLPLFGTEYYLGERLIDGRASENERSIHVGVATAIGGLFAVNTVTGVWNLWDSRKNPAGRTKRFVHAALMLSADAGFALAAAAAGDGEDRNTHKAIALTSIGISTAGTALMWFWRN